MLVTERNKRRLCAMNQLLRNQQLATLEPLVIEEAQHGLLDDEAFDAARALDLVPLTIYVVAVVFLGIYLSSFVLIAFFMKVHGKFGWLPTAITALGVPLGAFLLFERWFLVPLPKGPIELMLGL